MGRTNTKVLRGIAGRILLLGSSILLTLAGAELVVRIMVGPVPGGVNIHQLICEYDPLLGWSKIPNASERYTTDEYDIVETINSKGLRSPEYSYQKEKGSFRILVVGDSFTEGYTVEFQELFTEVLGRRLNRGCSRGKYEVINGGTGGYSTDQELLFFRSEGRKYQTDLVVVMFVDNDVWFNAQPEYPRAPKPLFELRDDKLTLVNLPVPRPTTQPVPQVEDGSDSLIRRAKRALSEKSALYRFIQQRVQSNHLLHTAAIRIGLAEAPRDERWPIAVPGVWTVFRRDPDHAVESAWDITEQLLLALRKDVLDADGQVLVAKVPSSFALHESQWKAMLKKYGVERENWNPLTVTERLRDICARADIPFLDLTPDFRDAIEVGRGSLYFPNDGHWTAEGHRIAGESLAGYISREFPPQPPAQFEGSQLARWRLRYPTPPPWE